MRRVVVAVVAAIFAGTLPSDLARGGSKKNPPLPKGAQFTIYCARIEGDAHVQRANRLKGELIEKTGMKDWYVIHDEQQSILYYGYYRAFNDTADKKESARAQGDLKKIKSLSMQGRPLFGSALFVDLEAPDPIAPPEWNLINAKGAWSLQIAAYKDSPLRKEAAVDAVREARKQGVEAYFYHGETVSSVCIGVWPEQAIRYEVPTEQISQPVVVNQPVITEPTDQAALPAEEMFGDITKHNAKVVQGKVVIVDPTLQAAMKQFPFHAVNGMQMVRQVEGKQVQDPSLLIRIPAPPEESPGLAGGVDPAGSEQIYQPGSAQQPNPPAPKPAPPAPGAGKLKSVDG